MPVDNKYCVEECGDGWLLGTYACDDGNTESGDGCTEKCVVEAGYSCAGEPSICWIGDIDDYDVTEETWAEEASNKAQEAAEEAKNKAEEAAEEAKNRISNWWNF